MIWRTGAQADYNHSVSEELKQAYRDRVLPYVQGPAQYVGGELNSIVKPGGVKLRVALAFPDAYPVGMSHLGTKVLYEVVNRRADAAAERVFAPWPDMEAKLVETGLPLVGLETFTPLHEMDLVAFSLSSEMDFTNILTILERGGLAILARDRQDADPIVIAGGHAAVAPEPLADFIDLFAIGDGEETMDRIVAEMIALKESNVTSRRERILALACRIPCLYAPSLYEPAYHADGTLRDLVPTAAGLLPVIKGAQVEDFDAAVFPTKPIIPFTEVVHDRITLEVMRGCPWKCRFCEATNVKRPVRLRTVETLVRYAEEIYKNTGYDEIALLSLSTSDYPYLEPLATELNRRFRDRKVSLSLPSLRVGEQIQILPKLLSDVRKSGMTLAPEVATDRLRCVIDKRIKNEDLFNGVREAYRHGWDLVKLYFMCGIPTETDEDIDGIINLAEQVSRVRKEVGKPPARVNATVSPFVPKGHIPFQWAPMRDTAYFEHVRSRLKRRVRGPIRIKFHGPERAFVEGVLARGDRKVGAAIYTAWKKGARFDSWDEHFKKEVWDAAFAEAKVDPAFYLFRERTKTERLPWQHIDIGRRPDFLRMEYDKALGLVPESYHPHFKPAASASY